MAGNHIARYRKQFLVRKTAGLFRHFLSRYDNLEYRQELNGEFFVLKTLARFPIKTIFDVGANVGNWSLAAASFFPGAGIHSFEISEETFRELAANTRGSNAVRCVNVGLAERDSTVQLHYCEGNSTLTTIFDYPHPMPSREVQAAVRTGSGYCKDAGVEHIDLLKIDVEGMDHLVLEGFADMFDRDAIDVVQFEYGKANILSRFLLRDFHQWFESRGFAVGKIYPAYVDFRSYSLDDENFMGPNFLACRRSNVDYLRALGGT